MKAQKRLNMIIVILIVILLGLVSFGGVYYKEKNQMVNRLPDYQLGADLVGYRTVSLFVKNDEDKLSTDSTSENAVENAVENTSTEATSENEVAENEVNETTEPKTNDEKISNYKKAAKVIKGRLKSLNIENYTVTCNESTGEIDITLPENDQTDTILSDLVETGKFSIKDSSSEEVLLDNSDVRNVEITDSTSEYGTPRRTMTINLTTKGAEKYKKITEDYQNTVNNTTSNSASEENSSADETAENSTDEASENTTDETSDSSSDSSKSGKQVTLNIDSSTLLTTDFTEIIDNGKITLTLNNSSSSTDEESDKTDLYSTYNLAAIIENDPLPIDYEIDGNVYIASNYSLNDMKILICAEIILAGVIATLLIIKYRKNGIIQAIVSVGYIALLLIMIRCANVSLSMEGIIAIGVCYIMNSLYSFILCNKLKEKKNPSKKELSRITGKSLKQYSLVTIPAFIVTVICTFVNWTSIYSLGMILFWGILISLIYNWIITKLINN